MPVKGRRPFHQLLMIDGAVNTYMYVYLALEVVVAVVAAILLKKT